MFRPTEPVRIPKAGREAIEIAIQTAVRSGKPWLLSDPASILGEEIPTGVLTDFLFWTRRTVHKILPQGDLAGQEQPYTCPSCGTTVAELCPSCQKVRHLLLAHCEHCGAKKELT